MNCNNSAMVKLAPLTDNNSRNESEYISAIEGKDL